VARAEALAEEVLLPAAETVDRADRVPAGHFDRLAEAGLYGVPGEDLPAVVEALASGCLTTAFVWLQHHGAAFGAAGSPRPGVRERWLGPLTRGERRAGIALAGLRPGPGKDPLLVRESGGWYELDGDVPWVTGWSMIDTLYLAARDADDVVHFFLLNASVGDGLTVEPLELMAVRASRTVTLRFAGHRVPADRLVSVQPYAEWAGADASGSALNGFLALGVARRCCKLIGPSPLDGRLADCRAALLASFTGSGGSGSGDSGGSGSGGSGSGGSGSGGSGGTGGVPAARAAASELAWRAAATLAVRTGSRAVLAGNPVARLSREATFLLVFGNRPSIRDALTAALTPPR
jgi:alkylation response protein AidB-like acyl-CoA dehydrogenase